MSCCVPVVRICIIQYCTMAVRDTPTPPAAMGHGALLAIVGSTGAIDLDDIATQHRTRTQQAG